MITITAFSELLVILSFYIALINSLIRAINPYFRDNTV